MSKKIEIDILLFILLEAIFLLFFFKESFFTCILGIILGIILILLTKNIKKNNITRLILIILSFPAAILTFYKIIDFIKYNVLKDYPSVTIIIPFLIITLYLLLKNYHTFIKTSQISFYFFLAIKIISAILIIPQINFNNSISILNTSCNYHFIYIGLITWYLYKSFNYINNYLLNKKRIIISFINPLLIKIITILVLGNTVFNIYKYPYVNYLKTIRYFDFIERLDGILIFEYLFSFFYLFIFLLFNIKLLYKNMFNK